MLKLGTNVRDSVTRLKGMLTHLQCETFARYYVFQPQLPLDAFIIDESRVIGGETIPDPYLALDVLGTDTVPATA